jgi:hypothetical protein
MHWLMTLYIAALFFVLTPGVLVSLPPGAKKITVALTHALVFALVYHLTHKMVWRGLYEGFAPEHPDDPEYMKKYMATYGGNNVSANANNLPVATNPPPPPGARAAAATPPPSRPTSPEEARKLEEFYRRLATAHEEARRRLATAREEARALERGRGGYNQ